MIEKNISPLIGASIGAGLGPLLDFQKLKLGNIVLCRLPDDKQEALKVVRHCREQNIHIMLSEVIHRHNHKRWFGEGLSKSDLEEIIAEAGEFFVGRYAVGEVGGMLYWPKAYVINEGVNAYASLAPCRNEADAHKAYVDYIRKELEFERNEICDCPLFSVDSSIAFSYLAEAGIDGQCIELLPGDPQVTLAAIRGAAKAANMTWGVHIAMLWYGGIRMDGLWLRRWRASLWISYMAGSDFIYPESGHLTYHTPDGGWFDFDSPELIRVRRELRKLYQFSQVHRRPAAGPATPVAILQGNDDGHPGIWNPYAWGQYENGTEWESSDAERGWELFDTLFCKEDLFHENVTGEYNFSGNPPCGQVDVIPPTADFSRYPLLLLTGYNRMNEALYEKLISYVKNGGHLVIWLSHFDNAEKRGDAVKLFRNGDLSELCGFKVTGRKEGDVHGMKYIRPSSFAQYDFPVRSICRDPYFIGRSEPAEIKLTDPEVKTLAVYSETFNDDPEKILDAPLLTERKLGNGAVFTVTSFTKPGANGMRKFAEVLVRTAVKAHLTDLELLASDTVRWAVYPAENGRKTVYALNCSELPQAVKLFYKGTPGKPILLDAGEFKTLYVDSDILLIPSDPLTDLRETDGNWILDTNTQSVELENLSADSREFSLNGVKVSLQPFERKCLECPAHIPAEKASFMDPAFADEPPMVMENTSTPY